MKISNTTNRKILLAAGIIVLFAILVPMLPHALVHAQDNTKYTLLEPLPCLPGAGSDCTAGGTTDSVSLVTYLAYAFNLLIALAAVAAVVMIVWGGFEYMTSASASGKGTGLNRAKNAIIGLLMVLCTYIVLQTVNPRLTHIPTTIVPPIAGLPRAVTSTSIFDILAQHAQTYQYVDNAQLKSNIADAQTKVNDLMTQKAALQDQLNKAVAAGGDNESTVTSLGAQISNIDNQIDAATSAAVLQSGQVDLQNTLSLATNGQAHTAAEIDRYEASVKNNYDIYASQMKNNPDQLQKLTDGKNFSMGILAMERDAIVVDPSANLESLKSAVTVIQTITTGGGNLVAKAIYKGFGGVDTTSPGYQVSSHIKQDVIDGIAPTIKDDNLRNQLINYANSVVANIKK